MAPEFDLSHVEDVVLFQRYVKYMMTRVTAGVCSDFELKEFTDYLCSDPKVWAAASFARDLRILPQSPSWALKEVWRCAGLARLSSTSHQTSLSDGQPGLSDGQFRSLHTQQAETRARIETLFPEVSTYQQQLIRSIKHSWVLLLGSACEQRNLDPILSPDQALTYRPKRRASQELQGYKPGRLRVGDSRR